MTDTTPAPTPLTLLGLGAMGTALAHAWLDAGHPLTVWNRTPGRAEALTARGARLAGSAAEAIAASPLTVLCLLDDASVRAALDGADLTDRDLVNLTTSTPAEARALAAHVRERGARFLDGGIMAVPPMIGEADSGAHVLYSGSPELFETHRGTLSVPAGARHVGADPGFAALHDVALLSAMSGMFAGVLHAFALLRREDVPPKDFAPMLADWLTAMAPAAYETADRLDSGDLTTGVASNLAMQVRGNATLLRTAEEQHVSPELLAPYFALLERRLAGGHGDEDVTGAVDLLLH